MLPSATRNLNLILSKYFLSFFDNQSNFSPEQSNLLCGAITGTGAEERLLYHNHETTYTSYKTTFISTSLSTPTMGEDLMNRSLFIEFPKITQTSYNTEKLILKQFEDKYASYFGGLLDVISHMLQVQDTIQLKKMPRMADFCVNMCAAGDFYGIPSEEMAHIMITNQNKEIISKVDDLFLLIHDYLEEHGNVHCVFNEFISNLQEYARKKKRPMRALQTGLPQLSKKLRDLDAALMTVDWNMNRISFYEKLEDHWYFISPELGYFLNIMDTPQAKTSQNKFTE